VQRNKQFFTYSLYRLSWSKFAKTTMHFLESIFSRIKMFAYAKRSTANSGKMCGNRGKFK